MERAKKLLTWIGLLIEGASKHRVTKSLISSGYFDRRPDAGIKVPITKGLLQRGKRRLTAAVADGDVIQLPLIVQRR